MKKKLSKKLIVFLMAICMVATFAPMISFGADSTKTADFTSDATATAALALLNASKTGEKASTWNATTKTLTLNGVDFSTSVAGEALVLPGGSTIVIADGTTNTIRSTYNGTVSSNLSISALRCRGNLTINGNTGELKVTAGNVTATSGNAYSNGISVNGSLVINGGNIQVNGGNVTATSPTGKATSHGIGAKNNITVGGSASIETKSGNATGKIAAYSYGLRVDKDITGDLVVKDNAKINSISGDATVTNDSTSATEITCYSVGASVWDAATISGNAQITATSGAATKSTAGDKRTYQYATGRGFSAGGTLTVSDTASLTGKVAGEVKGLGTAGASSCGVECESLVQNGGSISGIVDTTTSVSNATNQNFVESYGVQSNTGLTVTGGTLNGTSGAVSGDGNTYQTDSYGIYIWGYVYEDQPEPEVTVTGGTITGTAGTSTNAYRDASSEVSFSAEKR